MRVKLMFILCGVLVAAGMLAGCCVEQNITDHAKTSPYAACDPKNKPSIDPNKDNYLIGYGSLMQLKSRLRTDKDAQHAWPIDVTGFKRVFGLRGNSLYPTTFLTLIQSPGSLMNAVYFKVDNASLSKLDHRESAYCRIKLSKKDLVFPNIKPPGPREGVFWVYAHKGASYQPATSQYPLTQSYVDIFLGGCFKIQQKFSLNNFARQCVQTTYAWPGPAAWVNDRVHARRPFATAYAHSIDRLLDDSQRVTGYTEHKIE